MIARWGDISALGETVPALEGEVVLNVQTVAMTVPYARLRRLRHQPEIIVCRLFSLWCHKRGYFYSRAELLCAVRSEIEYRPELGTTLHHFFADYGVLA